MANSEVLEERFPNIALIGRLRAPEGVYSSLKIPNSQTNLGKDLTLDNGIFWQPGVSFNSCTFVLFCVSGGCRMSGSGSGDCGKTPLQFVSQIWNWQAMFPAPHSSFTVRRTASCRPRTRPGHLERLGNPARCPSEIVVTGPQRRVEHVSHMTCVCACR